MPEILTLDGVAALLKPGMTVFVQGSIGQPTAILEALGRSSRALEGVHFVSPLTPGLNGFPFDPGNERNRLTTFFDYKGLRQTWQGGRIDFVPLHYSEIVPWLRGVGRIDLAIIMVAEPHDDGGSSVGLAADFVPDILPRCDAVLAQCNPSMPRMAGAPVLPAAKLDYVVHADRPLPVVGEVANDATSAAIAQNVATLVRDGDTIQYGVGRLPQLAAAELVGKQDLGLHTGLASPVMRQLVESGALTGRLKSRDRGRHITGAICGDRAFYDWCAASGDIALRPVSYTHDIEVLGSIDNLVAINSALEVDLFGQTNAEMAGRTQISATGGLVDFLRGARRSRDGRAIICLPSARAGGTKSNIVPRIESIVTVARTDIDFVVTEHGMAELAYLSTEKRAEALIAIAAPQFRDMLEDGWRGTASS
jgi:4-hydroxybutyrate CoA-transferase